MEQSLSCYRSPLCESCKTNQTRHQIPNIQLEWSAMYYGRGVPPQNRPWPVGLTNFGLRKAEKTWKPHSVYDF